MIYIWTCKSWNSLSRRKTNILISVEKIKYVFERVEIRYQEEK